jgi:hypothetical protein
MEETVRGPASCGDLLLFCTWRRSRRTRVQGILANLGIGPGHWRPSAIYDDLKTAVLRRPGRQPRTSNTFSTQTVEILWIRPTLPHRHSAFTDASSGLHYAGAARGCDAGADFPGRKWKGERRQFWIGARRQSSPLATSVQRRRSRSRDRLPSQRRSRSQPLPSRPRRSYDQPGRP